jgi:predicted amidophosphoribosyltransferase
MATVNELAALLEGSMLNPAARGPGICPICRGFPNPGWDLDWGCGRQPNYLDVVAPISYAPGLGQLHTALRHYKRSPFVAIRSRFHLRLAAVLWKFLDTHEACVGAAAGARDDHFDVVCVVPSKVRQDDEARPFLRDLVGATCGHTSARFERLLRATDQGTLEREYDPARYAATRRLDGEHVLLIDDTWTSGASAQNAGYALKDAGAASVGFVAIGRFVRRDWADHGPRLDALPRPFDWATCAVHDD